MADETDFQLQNSNQAIEFAKESVRLGVTVNGGAAVAIIGFLGAKENIADPSAIRAALLYFSIGVAISFLAIILGYFSQTFFAQHNYRRTSGKYSIPFAAYLCGAIGIACILSVAVTFIIGVFVAGKALFV
jgi:hypothetical protein